MERCFNGVLQSPWEFINWSNKIIDQVALLRYNMDRILLQGVRAVNIRPSASIRQNYNEIADLCRSTKEPVYLTKNGEGDLVVMDIESFTRREKMLKLREELLLVEEDRVRGNTGYTIDEMAAMLDRTIREAPDER